MFSSIKDNLLKTVTLFSIGSEAEKCKNVDFNAGSPILKHFEEEWQSLHTNNEENAKKAEEIAATISGINEKVNKDKENLGLVVHLVDGSNLTGSISNCTKQIEVLYEQFNRIEEELLHLEDFIDTISFEAMKKQHRFHLEQYRIRKDKALVDVEKSLQESYSQSLHDYELKKKKELEERQQVFQEAFKNDIEIFKNCGVIPKLDLPKKQPSALLEEIQVDYDENELDKFLDESPAPPSDK